MFNYNLKKICLKKAKNLLILKAWNQQIVKKNLDILKYKSQIYHIIKAEIFTFSSFNVVFKVFNDVHVYVVADYEENEALL